MWPIHPFQKHFCILFISIALITTFISIKEKCETHQDNVPPNYTDVLLGVFERNLSTEQEYFSIENNFIKYINFSSENVVRNEGSDNRVIYVLGLFELTTKWGRRLEGESEMSAAKLAVDHINAFNVLPGYALELLINDTQCDPGVGIDRFFHALYSKKTILMLLGAGCSNVSERLAHVVPYWNIIQVSFGSTSPSLSDRNKFPLFFRTVAPDSSHNSAKIHFVKEFGWKVVATFSQSENEYLLPVNRLITDLERVNVSCISTVTFSLDNYKEQLRVLKDLDIRIIIGSFSTSMASKIFCAVHEMDMFGEYVWILQNREELWWNTSKDCSFNEIQKAVEGIIMISDFNSISDDGYSTLGTKSHDFENALNVSKLYISKYVRQTYDAVWAMALALRENEIYYWRDLPKDYEYTRKYMVCRWVEKLRTLRFIGLSGPVRFNGADRIGNSIIRQIQDGELIDIAIFDSMKDILDFECRTCRDSRWKNGQIPVAQRILKISIITIPNALFYSVVLVSVMGIGASFLFLYFNLHFRRIKSVKLSSPKLNNVAVFGCILVYSSVILLGFHNSTIKSNVYFRELCLARVYLLSAGFSLAFGSMFAKTYRVHRLFTYFGAALVKDKLLKDKQLIGLILIPIIIDALILTLWVMIDPMEKQLHNLTLEVSYSHRGVVYQPQVEICSSRNTEGWYVALFGYKSIIVVMGVFMAWKTRDIKVPALNDSQYIGICVYSAMFSTIIVTLSSFISNYVVLTYIAKATSILTSTTLTLFLLFLPKLKSVFTKIDCEDPIMLSMGLKIESNTRRFIFDDPREQLCRLEIQNKVYRCELAALDREISHLEGLLCSSTACSTKSSVNVIETTVDYHYLRMSTPLDERASWPRSQDCLKKCVNKFLSENRLNSERAFEKIKLFDKLKKFFGSFNSLNSFQQHNIYQDYNLFRLRNGTEKIRPRSDPEVYPHLQDPVILTQAKSEIFIRN